MFHYFFPQIVQFTYYSSVFYWVSIPLLWNQFIQPIIILKPQKKSGYETQLGRAIRIIWAVGISWIFIVAISLLNDVNPVQDILFLLGTSFNYVWMFNRNSIKLH